MEYLLVVIVTLLFVSISDGSGYNKCIVRTKSDYVYKRDAEYTTDICGAFFHRTQNGQIKKPQQLSPLRFIKLVIIFVF